MAKVKTITWVLRISNNGKGKKNYNFLEQEINEEFWVQILRKCKQVISKNLKRMIQAVFLAIIQWMLILKSESDTKSKRCRERKQTSINFPRSNLGAFRIFTLRMNTFCKGYMLEVAFSISLPIISGMNFLTKSLRSQDAAWATMISLILRRIWQNKKYRKH